MRPHVTAVFALVVFDGRTIAGGLHQVRNPQGRDVGGGGTRSFLPISHVAGASREASSFTSGHSGQGCAENADRSTALDHGIVSPVVRISIVGGLQLVREYSVPLGLFAVVDSDNPKAEAWNAEHLCALGVQSARSVGATIFRIEARRGMWAWRAPAGRS